MADEEDDGCSRCGKCCMQVIMPFSLGGVLWQEWYEVHGCTVVEGVGLLIPSVCQHLQATGLARPAWKCDIYETRPLLCRNEYIRQRGMGSWKPEGCTRREPCKQGEQR